MPPDCSSSERILPPKNFPGTRGGPKASLTTGLSEPPISSDPLPAPTCRPVSHVISPSRISLPISFNSVWGVCALMLLLVVGHDGLEKILEPFVAAVIVLARHLEQQLFELIQAAQAVPRNGVCQAGAQHDKLVLAFAFRCADGAPHRAVKAAQRTGETRFQFRA